MLFGAWGFAIEGLGYYGAGLFLFEGRRLLFAQDKGGHLSSAEGSRMDLKRTIRKAQELL